MELLGESKQRKPNLIDIFNSSQHVTTSDVALTQLKKLYKNTEYHRFEGPFKDCVKKLLQSKQTIYFKTSCEFLCKFLQHVSKLSDEFKAKERNDLTFENTDPATKNSKAMRAATKTARAKRGRQTRRGTKRKADFTDDELVLDFIPHETTGQNDSTTDDDSLVLEQSKRRRITGPSRESALTAPIITNHDRIISACIDVADHYMQVADEECRLNAVFFVCKFLAHVESLDEEICDALKSTLPKRIRDRKPAIRAQAVLASRTFQDNKMTQEGFLHHFYRDPELVVRKALLQIMDTKIFGYDFIVDSTQDTHESMRKAAFQRLGKLSPRELSLEQLHRGLHNGLNERERQASYAFKTHSLQPWLSCLYDGLDLCKLLESFDVLHYHDDVSRLLRLICERDLERLQNNGTTTQLHHVVESFRESWLNADNTCLPPVSQINIRIVTVWLTLVRFCRTNQSIIKPVKVRNVEQQTNNPNESIERILNSQERNDELVELYERLTPDLVNLVGFLRRFVQHSYRAIKAKEVEVEELEFIYQELMKFVASYEVGDELERKTVQEVFGNILKENLLTGIFSDFITPIVRCLFNLIYSSSSNLMINYISELINNVRSHLDDLMASTQSQCETVLHSAIEAPSQPALSSKKATKSKKVSYAPDLDQQSLEFKIATMRVKIEELKDELEICIKEKDFDQAKTINNRLEDLQAELTLLHTRRCSIASDVSHMSMIVENDPGNDGKLSSTMIGDNLLDCSQSSSQNKDEVKYIFKHHSNELIKCLQMYFGCLQSVKISEVPQTMLNHLNYLSYECLAEWFKSDRQIRSLMVDCNGLTALVDKQFASEPTTLMLLSSACYDPISIEVRTSGLRCLVDIICQHEELNLSTSSLEKFLKSSLRDYGKYNPNDIKKSELDFITSVVTGATKLFYFKKLSSPEILSHLILWWYHPRTHSRLKQYIGIFLPTFVNEANQSQPVGDTWLQDLLEETFIISIEYLHDYILGPGFNIMAASDMHSLINFLCTLIPFSLHKGIADKVDIRMEELSDSCPDLHKYLKLSRNVLSTQGAHTLSPQPVPTPE